MNNAAVASTPYFTLIDGQCRIGPGASKTSSGLKCEPIYGFSNKRLYDIFCSVSQSSLKPYPLVKVYLKDQLEKPDAGLQLVVIDAAGPDEPYLHAATMRAVLGAQETRLAFVCAAYRLVWEPQANEYHVREAFRLLTDKEAMARLGPKSLAIAHNIRK